MGASDIRAGGGYIELWLEKARLNSGLKSVEGDMKAWAANITSLGVGLTALGSAIVAPITLSAKAFADHGARIDDFSQRTGAGSKAISELWYAAEQTGTSIEVLERGFKGLASTINGALHGEKEAKENLADLGLTVAQLIGQKPEDQFAMIADKIAGITDPSHRAGIALKIFGKSALELVPMLSTGAAGLAQMRAEADRLGLSMSTEDVKAAAAFDDSLQALWRSIKGITFAIGGAMSDELKAAADLFVSISKPIGQFIRDNGLIITTLAASGAAILAIGGALTTLGLGMTLIGTAITGLSSLAGLLTAVALNPITWVVAAGAAVIGVIGYVTGGFDMMYQAANNLVSGVTQTVQGVANAIRAGKIEHAWGIVNASLQIGWLSTTNYLADTWADFCWTFESTFLDAVRAMDHHFLNLQVSWNTKFGDGQLEQFAPMIHGGIDAAHDTIKNSRRGPYDDAKAMRDMQLGMARDMFDFLTDLVAPDPAISAGEVPDVVAAAHGAHRKKHHSKESDGTFSARGAAGLGLGNMQERTAKASEETAKNTKEAKKLLEKFQAGLVLGP